MDVVCGLSATTFKPEVDRHIAMESEGVVLWYRSNNIIVLSHEGGTWRVRRHVAADPAAAADGLCGKMQYRGVHYAREGEQIVALGEDADAAAWRRVYQECRGW